MDVREPAGARPSATGWPAAMVRGPGPPPIQRPGAATAAAVLALVESGLGLLVACLLILGVHPRPVTFAVLAILVLLAAGAPLSVGAVHVLRGSGWRLLVAVTTVQVVLVLGLVGWAVAVVPGPGKVTGLVLGVLLLALPATRLVLAVRPSVGRWVARGTSRRWAPSLAVLLPFAAVVLLLGAALADPPGPTPDPADLLAATDADRYDGGRPVPPPLSAAADYDPAFDGLAQDCFDGDMVACDDMFVEAPEGSAYAYLGDTCGGREYESVDGACQYLLPG